MVDWHKVEIGLPKLASLTDEQLERLYVERDGRWSSSIKAAMARFSTDKLDLDDNWASRSQRWECPGCCRRKPDLLRVSAAGVLLARLDIHHDHLTDHLKALLHARHGPQWRLAIPPDSAHLEQFGVKLIARFERSYVCLDCNAADGAVKSRLRDIPRPFSFRPSEIRRFVNARPNVEHQIDFDAAYAIFAEQQADYERRVALIEMLAALTLAGDMTMEAGNMPSPLAGNPMGMMRHLDHWFLRELPEQHSEIANDITVFEARSVSRDGVATNSRRKRSPAAQPTAEDVASYDGGGAADLWRVAPVDWRCPACERDRTEILRRSNNSKRRWSGKLVRHTEYILAQPDAVEGASGHRLEPFIDRHEPHLICLDCANIISHLKARRPAIAASEAIFQFADMRASAVFAPNTPHEVDWAVAEQRARDSLTLAARKNDYWQWHNQAAACRSDYRKLLRLCGDDPKQAWARLKTQYADDLAGREDSDEWLEYLLSEADRIAIPDPFRVEGRTQSE